MTTTVHHPLLLSDLCACGHTSGEHHENYGRCFRAACGCARFRAPAPRNADAIWTFADDLKFEAPGATVEVLDDDLLRVWLDDCTDQDAARKLLGAHIPKGSSVDHLAYVGSGVVRVTWNAALIGDYRVIFTDVNDLNEVMHRAADIKGLTDAELGEYVYDDTGADL